MLLLLLLLPRRLSSGFDKHLDFTFDNLVNVDSTPRTCLSRSPR